MKIEALFFVYMQIVMSGNNNNSDIIENRLQSIPKGVDDLIKSYVQTIDVTAEIYRINGEKSKEYGMGVEYLNPFSLVLHISSEVDIEFMFKPTQSRKRLTEQVFDSICALDRGEYFAFEVSRRKYIDYGEFGCHINHFCKDIGINCKMSVTKIAMRKILIALKNYLL